MRIEPIETLEGFAALMKPWRRLLERSPDASVFLSWEWLYQWWQHYGRQQPLHLLTAWVDDELVGLLPLYIEEREIYGPIKVRLLRFIGTGGDTAPDYLGPLLHETHAEEAARQLAQYAIDKIAAWDVLYLTDLTRDTMFWQSLQDACRRARLPIREALSARIATVELPSSWDEYLANLHRDRRYTIRNTRRKFEALPNARFFVVRNGEDLDQAFDNLVDLHHRRWQSQGQQHAFSTPEYVGFHRAAASASAANDWIRFYCLEAEGQPVAVFYCYRFRDEVFYFQAGFNPQFEKYRPGLVLIGYALEHAISEGSTLFDFMQGEHEYKKQWGKTERCTYQISAFRPSAGTAAYRWTTEIFPTIKQLIKDRLPFLQRNARSHH